MQECGVISIWRVWQKAGVSRFCEGGGIFQLPSHELQA